jgi:flagellar protein FlbD
MIRLTRLNHSLLTINCDLIKFVEQSPDTVITLVDGEKVLVLETADDILDRMVQFRRSLLQGIVTVGFPAPVISPSACNEEKTTSDKSGS